MTAQAETGAVCKCGHHEQQHDMDMDDKNRMCLQSQCSCWNFTDETQPQARDELEKKGQVRKGKRTKQEHSKSSNNEISPNSRNKKVRGNATNSRNKKARLNQPNSRNESSNNSTQSQPQPKPQSPQSQQPSVSDDLDTEIRKIKEELGKHFVKCDELVKRLGNAIKKAGIVKESDICHEIKIILAEEIADQKLSVRTIDRCCPDKWKKITKPKKKDKMSFSPQQIAVTQDGNSEIAPPQRHREQPEEKSASTQTDSKPAEQDIEKPAPASTPTEPVSTVDSEPQKPPHNITILLRRDSLSEQMEQVPHGIKWVQLSGVLDEKSRIVSNLKLTNGRAEGGV